MRGSPLSVYAINSRGCWLVTSSMVELLTRKTTQMTEDDRILKAVQMVELLRNNFRRNNFLALLLDSFLVRKQQEQTQFTFSGIWRAELEPCRHCGTDVSRTRIYSTTGQTRMFSTDQIF